MAAAQHPDPAWNPATLTRPVHAPLAEEYIWTSGDAAALRPDHGKFNYRTVEKKTDPHFFRADFELAQVPTDATVYVAGPRAARVWLNGTLVLDAKTDPQTKLPSQVFRADVRNVLHIGRNVIAIEAVRGRSIVAASDALAIQQVSFGETMVAKILPAAPGLASRKSALLLSNAAWRSTTTAAVDWQLPSFDDSKWPRVQLLGAIESRPDFFTWNLDAGLYDWPGYMGMSPNLRTYTVEPVAITHPLQGVPADPRDQSHVLVDFGREIAGRILIESGQGQSVHLLASYGESQNEALSSQHYLGRFEVRLAPGQVARGPKSGFRYVWLNFFGGVNESALRSIRAEGIAYPVEYKGSFRSSDPVLNRIWEAGAYTAHLCMQDGIFDAAKRDRGWWAGDLDVAGPVITSVFANQKLLDETLTHLVPPRGAHVNGIPGYTALWISALADLYRRTGDRTLLEGRHATVLQLLSRMDEEFDAQGRFLNKGHHWLFVDWSPEMFAFTPEAAEGTAFEMVRGYREAAWLLAQMGDKDNSVRYDAHAKTLAVQLRGQYSNSVGSYGSRWQLNAMAVLAGVTEQQDYTAIWKDSLGQANADSMQTISPYFNAYVLEAMARMNRRTEALQWLRTYWGGMMNAGATSLWEAYDLHGPKENPHSKLEADGRVGYFVSLAHAWSGWPTVWMMQELLGVHAVDPGYSKATIRPELAGLEWIEGTVPTPHGAIHVTARKAQTEIEIPAGIEAELLLPLTRAKAKVAVNGKSVAFTSTEDGARASVTLHGPGRFVVSSR